MGFKDATSAAEAAAESVERAAMACLYVKLVTLFHQHINLFILTM